jgi:hypothetical protein
VPVRRARLRPSLVSLHLLPSKSWQFDTAWVLVADIAADLDAWMRLLLLQNELELAAAEPETIRTQTYYLPAYCRSPAPRPPV